MAKMYNDWDVWQSVKNGDEAVYNRLVAECMEYADKKSLHTIEYYEGKGYYLDGMRDDLIQEGRIATLKAIDKYDPIKGGRFTRYAGEYYIEKSIKLYIMKNAVTPQSEQIASATHEEEERRRELEKEFAPEETAVKRDRVECVRRTMKAKLSQREYEMVSMHFGIASGREMTMAEIGEVYGTSRQCVSQIIKKAERKLEIGLRVVA